MHVWRVPDWVSAARSILDDEVELVRPDELPVLSGRVVQGDVGGRLDHCRQRFLWTPCGHDRGVQRHHLAEPRDEPSATDQDSLDPHRAEADVHNGHPSISRRGIGSGHAEICSVSPDGVNGRPRRHQCDEEAGHCNDQVRVFAAHASSLAGDCVASNPTGGS
jgi:hypothetical protein